MRLTGLGHEVKIQGKQIKVQGISANIHSLACTILYRHINAYTGPQTVVQDSQAWTSSDLFDSDTDQFEIDTK